MLLILSLGLIAKLVLVCDGCNLGTSKLNNFNISQFAGNWYGVLHSSNPITNNFGCFVGNFGNPSLGKFLVTVTAYLISTQVEVTFKGYGKNWNNTGYFEFNGQVGIWNGPVQLIAVDYSRYVIAKVCPIGLIESSVYVGYRTPQPDAATVNQRMADLQKNGIDLNKILNWPACQ